MTTKQRIALKCESMYLSGSDVRSIAMKIYTNKEIVMSKSQNEKAIGK